VSREVFWVAIFYLEGKKDYHPSYKVACDRRMLLEISAIKFGRKDV